jgi:hypothetical protein
VRSRRARVGEDNRHITTIDAEGVALAAIQGLYSMLKEKDAQLAAQQHRIDSLQVRLDKLERQTNVGSVAISPATRVAEAHELH